MSHQSLFPMTAVEPNTLEVYNNAPSHLDASRILVQNKSLLHVQKKKKQTRHCPDAF